MQTLMRVRPESLGMPSSAVLDFLEFIKETRYNLHSFILIKDGKIISEGHYAPFVKSDRHRLYSSTKTLAALAVGKLVGEGLASLDAPIISYFPEFCCTDERLLKTTLEDALKMAVPINGNPYISNKGSDPDAVTTDEPWVENFFLKADVTDKEHGRSFSYNSHASYILGALVKKLTGKEFLDYLRPEFDKIGVSQDIKCVKSPEGTYWASSGALMTTEDFAKIGMLLMNRGEFSGEQLLPRDYMERATSAQIDNVFEPMALAVHRGYGYQIWIEPYGFSMHGMLGQVAFAFPDKNFLFVCNSCEPDYLGRIYYAASRLYKSIKDSPLPDSADFERLSAALADLKIDRAFGKAHSNTEGLINAKRYTLPENKSGIRWFELDFKDDFGIFRYEKDAVIKELRFGYADFADTVFPETKYYGMTMCRPMQKEPRALVTGSWTSENKLLIVCDLADTLKGTLSISLEFYENKVAVNMKKVAEGAFGEYQGLYFGTLCE